MAGSSSKTNFYEVLGVPPTASPQDIRSAYKKLARKFHPDRPTGDVSKFQSIQEAYETLSSPEKRRRYDHSASAAQETADFASSASSFMRDFFSNAFNTQKSWDFNFTGGQASPVMHFSSDRVSVRTIRLNAHLTLEQAQRGTEYEFQLRRRTLVFEDSQQTEAQLNDIPFRGRTIKIDACSTCNGSGTSTKVKSVESRVFHIRRPCQTCSGRGYSEAIFGRTETISLKIRLPGGQHDGSSTEFASIGHAYVIPDPLSGVSRCYCSYVCVFCATGCNH